MQDNILTHKAIKTGNLTTLALDPGPGGPDDTQSHDKHWASSSPGQLKPTSYELLRGRQFSKLNIYVCNY